MSYIIEDLVHHFNVLIFVLMSQEHDCKLTQEIIELIDREADLLMRGTKESNLEGLRKRISNLFLQYIKTPTFNAEAARLLKVCFTQLSCLSALLVVSLSESFYGYTVCDHLIQFRYMSQVILNKVKDIGTLAKVKISFDRHTNKNRQTDKSSSIWEYCRKRQNIRRKRKNKNYRNIYQIEKC